MHILATLTRLELFALVALPVVIACIPLLVHHIACEIRIDRARRRDRELIDSRKAANRERRWAQHAADDAGIAAARVERDEARVERNEARALAMHLIDQLEHLQATNDRLASELQGARDYVSRLNRAALRQLSKVIEADKTIRLPAVRAVAPTRELPVITAPAHHRRRSVLAPV